jgi:hypothetical protein
MTRSTRSTRHTGLDLHAADVRARSEETDVKSARGAKDAKGTDLRQMRQLNRMLVLNCVRMHGAIARAEVARHTGLSRTTIGNIVDDLLREGLVHESESQREIASGGRRVIPVHFNATYGYLLGVAMGRNHVTMLLADLAANVVKRSDVPFATARGPDVCLPELAAHLRAFVVEQRVAWSKVLGIGLGIPVPVNGAQEVPAAPPRMPGWHGTPVRALLEAELQKPVLERIR